MYLGPELASIVDQSFEIFDIFENFTHNTRFHLAPIGVIHGTESIPHCSHDPKTSFSMFSEMLELIFEIFKIFISEKFGFSKFPEISKTLIDYTRELRDQMGWKSPDSCVSR